MLAGVEETLHAREPFRVTQGTAIETVLAGLIDYAGLYPPAGLDMRSAVDNYRRYRKGPQARALGRFIIDLSRMDELRSAAANLDGLRLSVLVSHPSQLDAVAELIDDGVPVESVEAKVASARDVEPFARGVTPNVEAFLEIPFASTDPDMLRAISDHGARAKLRMGGVTAEAFPPAVAVARILEALSRAQLAFKATAGLHHPIRSRHSFTYAQDSPRGMMHGFINLICAMALLRSGVKVEEAERVLAEEDVEAWSLTSESLAWRSFGWSADQLSETRKGFVSFGSCSFEEPIRDLEALGWL